MLRAALKIFLSLLLLIPLCRATAQNSRSGIDSVFGFDQVLYNGRQYIYQIPKNATGNPFLFGGGFEKGWITVMDRTYSDLLLNYDIVNQALLMKYVDVAGAIVVLEISESWLNSFGIGTTEFKLHQQGGIRPVFYQVIRNKSLAVQYYWRKELNLENVTSTPVYAFSQPKRTSILNLQGKEYAYDKNRDFLKVFDPVNQVKIRNYLRNRKIKVNKSSDIAIQELVNFCNTLIDP